MTPPEEDDRHLTRAVAQRRLEGGRAAPRLDAHGDHPARDLRLAPGLDLYDRCRARDVGHGDGGTAMLDTVRTLDAAKLEPTTLVLREPTLDDVFLELTGHCRRAATEATSPCPPPPATKESPMTAVTTPRRHRGACAEGRPSGSSSARW
jgi:hypothetical protein